MVNFMVRPLTHEPHHHFFGYYGINPWGPAGTRHLALQTTFDDHIPKIDDVADVGLVDRDSGRFQPLAQTAAFNLQQGAMLHWVSVDDIDRLTFNTWRDGRAASTGIDPLTGDAQHYEAAIAAVSPSEPIAMGLDYGRMYHCREVVGYTNDHDQLTIHPSDDGLLRIDLRTGKAELIVPIDEVVGHVRPPLTDTPVWFNHVIFNPTGTRLMFLARVRIWDNPKQRFHTSLWTVNPDGSDLQCRIPYGHVISHFTWRSPTRLLISSSVLDGRVQFVEFTDGEQDFAPLGKGVLPNDGHMWPSPDGQWLVTDAYPGGKRHEARLMLYHFETGESVDFGMFPHPRKYTGAIRCDLHPRWHPNGKAITFDSVHEGSRQIYIVELDL
jgi:hypothetical protein